jgi:putative phosphoesterase
VTDGSSRAAPFLIGIVSDTHGELSDAAYEALRGADVIVHAGDIGAGLVLDLLETIAPVVLVRGNNRYAAEEGRPVLADVILGGVRVVVVHRREDLPRVFAPGAPVRLIVTGHTHVGRVEARGGVLRVDPGSPSLPRRGSARSVALVAVYDDGLLVPRLTTFS